MLPIEEHHELFNLLALTFVPGVGGKTGRALLEKFGNATNIFKAPIKELKCSEGIGEVKAKGFKDLEVKQKAEKELNFVLKNNLQVVYLGQPTYPTRLNNCIDAPMLMFYKGNADLNQEKIVSIVGTRKNTDYGHKLTEELVEGLKGLEKTLVVSGLALGVDAIAHRRCLQVGIPTVGVLGHGLDRIYPSMNQHLARDMVENGGVLAEFPSGTIPDKMNFPRRNRIVAGMADVTVVIESQIAGGALITAYMASSYNREVAAFPGRVNDSRSAGCNELIRTNIASMVTKAEDLIDLMNWADKAKKKPVQRQLFINLTPDEEKIMGLLQTKDLVHSDELYHHTGLPSSTLAATLLNLEMQGLVKTLPGKFYRVN